MISIIPAWILFCFKVDSGRVGWFEPPLALGVRSYRGKSEEDSSTCMDYNWLERKGDSPYSSMARPFGFRCYYDFLYPGSLHCLLDSLIEFHQNDWNMIVSHISMQYHQIKFYSSMICDEKFFLEVLPCVGVSLPAGGEGATKLLAVKQCLNRFQCGRTTAALGFLDILNGKNLCKVGPY